LKINKISSYINRTPYAQKLLKGISNSPAEFSALSAFGVATFIRPLGISAIPMRNKEDKKYSIASSIAAGITEIIMAPLVFTPMKKLFIKIGKVLSKNKKSVYEDEKICYMFSSINNRIFKMLLVPFVAIGRFALISPVVKALFKKRKENEYKNNIRLA
jgi:hypothetical protein